MDTVWIGENMTMTSEIAIPLNRSKQSEAPDRFILCLHSVQNCWWMVHASVRTGVAVAWCLTSDPTQAALGLGCFVVAECCWLDSNHCQWVTQEETKSKPVPGAKLVKHGAANLEKEAAVQRKRAKLLPRWRQPKDIDSIHSHQTPACWMKSRNSSTPSDTATDLEREDWVT